MTTSSSSAPTSDEKPADAERIAKRMARAGLCSRRDAERWIEAGRVKVNGKLLTTPAHTVTPRDRIEVDDKLLGGPERTRLWLLNKRSGLVTTNKDPEGRTTIFERLPDDLPRVLSVGRLDINTEGLLLLTNDGGLARVLELPTTGWLRRYRVRAHGQTTQEELDKLADGIAVDGVLYGAIEAELERQQGTNVWLTFAMREGKNREVKNVLSALGLEVNRLIRISYGPFQLGDLASGEVQEVRGRMLRQQLGAKLISASGADFDAPLAATAPKNNPVGEKIEKARPNKRGTNTPRKADPLERLTTQKPTQKPGTKPSDGRGRGAKDKSSNKPGNKQGGRGADRRR
ncbi:pseudouridine synthase [Ahrensia sp. R2A130]|uniref:pseudouridine synthase n=1 Tax=Ahrensia sp. R2A130 TaxID=744979 RepID=UPI0001E09476|nr:ribosomal large subunit pseudouridine synthase B [Ahrensia sp. R2A130]